MMIALPSEYTIRQATLADAEAVAFVHVQVWKSAYANIIEQSFLDKQLLAERLALRYEILTHHVGINLVATHYDKIVAFYDAGPLLFHENQQLSQHQLINRNELGEVYAIYILPEHQHLGIGTALFNQGREALKEKGLTPFIAWVLKDNHKAITFYKKLGGMIVDETLAKIGEKYYSESAFRFN